MQEAARTSETLVNFYQTTRRYNPEDSHLRICQIFFTVSERGTGDCRISKLGLGRCGEDCGSRVRISAQTGSSDRCFLGFPNSFRTNAGISPKNRPRPIPSSLSLSSVHYSHLSYRSVYDYTTYIISVSFMLGRGFKMSPNVLWLKVYLSKQRGYSAKACQILAGWTDRTLDKIAYWEDLHNLHSSPNIIRVIKSRRMRWVGHVARMASREAMLHDLTAYVRSILTCPIYAYFFQVVSFFPSHFLTKHFKDCACFNLCLAC
jgi:hypothetical protein